MNDDGTLDPATIAEGCGIMADALEELDLRELIAHADALSMTTLLRHLLRVNRLRLQLVKQLIATDAPDLRIVVATHLQAQQEERMQ